MTPVILNLMKTAISLPDELFDRAEALAERLGVARSQLYAQALSEFVDRHRTSDITARLNAVYESEESELDPVIVALQSAALSEEN